VCLLQDARTQFDTQIEKKKFLFDDSFDLLAISLCRDEKKNKNILLLKVLCGNMKDLFTCRVEGFDR